MPHIGVLALQGAVSEHIKQVEAAGCTASRIKFPSELASLDGLIIPGGESTAIKKLMDTYGFTETIQSFQKPIFGTCAGMVLLASKIADDSDPEPLGLIDLVVQRNASGRQRASFETSLAIKGLDEPFKAIFIRAPYCLHAGESVVTLADYDGHIVAAKQGRILVSSFHPELTDDSRFLELFIQMVKEHCKDSAIA
ncbi:pyridoxal 5'-phosphate synthase glutaminase subunit PdxT [Gracilibacillus sp. Marseille-QA3620]